MTAEKLVARGVKSVQLVMFIDALASSLGVSVLPYYVQTLGGTPSQFGALLSTFASANIIASLWIGSASDKFGRKPLLVLSLIGLSVGFSGCALTPSMGLLFVARAIIGFFAGVGSTGRAYVADICTKEERGKVIASLGGLMMFGYAAGPPIGAAICGVVSIFGLRAEEQQRTPFFAGAFFSLVAVVIVSVQMPTVATIKAAKAADESAAAAVTTTAVAVKGTDDTEGGCRTFTSIGLLLLSSALAQAAVAGFLVVQPMFIKDMFGWGPPQVHW